MDETLEAAKEGKFREVAAIDASYERGAIDDAGWHREMAALIVPAYLGARDEQGGSGHGGTAADWEYSRGIVAEAIDRSGSFLDVGCANGLLMESVAQWGAATGLALEPHGLEISPELADLARRRLPRWIDRIFVGNALGWKPPMRFDFVRTGLEYVPRARRRELVAWLLDEVVAPGGRLIIGKVNEEIEPRYVEDALVRWGFVVRGRAERAHRGEPRLVYRVAWLEAPKRLGGDIRFRALRHADLPLMQRWLSLPHVATWWREPLDLDGVRKKLGPRIDGSESTHVYVIERGARPIGWIQWYRWKDYPEHAARLDAEPRAAGLDIAIGEPDMLRKGIGPRAIDAFVREYVFADPSITACISDPELRNIRSVRAFEKAGFRVIGTAEAHVRGVFRRSR